MESVTLTIHFKNRVRLFYPKHLPGHQLTTAIQKTFDLGSDEEIELVDRISHEHVRLSDISKLPPNSHLVLSLVLKPNLRYFSNKINNKRNTLLSKEKTVVVHKENGSFGFQVQYFFAPSHNNLASPYHRMSTIFVKQLDASGPAARAGLKQGDRILRINGGSVLSLTLEDVVSIMRKREDYVVLTTVPWYKDYLQVEYPEYAYSEPSESDTSTNSLDRCSLHTPPQRRTPPQRTTQPHLRTRGNHSSNDNNVREHPLNTSNERNAFPILLESPKKPGSGRSSADSKKERGDDNSSGSTGSGKRERQHPSHHHNNRNIRRSPGPPPSSSSPPTTTTTGGSEEVIPVKPPRPNYVLRRHHHNQPDRTTWQPNPRPTPVSDTSRRYGNLQYFEDFQLPEKPPSSNASKSESELDPLCEALKSQAQVSPSVLQKMNSDMSMEGNLECKIYEDTNKRHTLRGWIRYFVAVSTDSMSLYKTYGDYVEKREKPEYGPVDISFCLVQIEYRLKKPVFRVICQNHNEYLFKAESNEDMMSWIEVIQRISNVSENQSLCNELIKRKADERLKADTGNEDNKNKRLSVMRVKEYNSTELQVNSQFDFPSFGTTIEKCIKCPYNKLVPAIVTGCVQEVEERGINTTGIYRLSGNAQAIQALINEIDKDPCKVDYKSAPWTDISNTCAVLKQYFRRLVEPLIPAELYPNFMSAVNENEHREVKLKELVLKLPDCHYETAKFLFRHLARVAANAEVNKMHTCNLAIIFGPTVIRSNNSDVSTMVTDMSNQCKVVECMISQYSYIFDDKVDFGEPKDNAEPGQQEDDETENIEPKDNEMGIFNKKYVPSANGQNTPSEDRASQPSGWEYCYTIDRTRKVETSDKCTQCNIPRNPVPTSSDDKIYYRKEPVGIVHPYKDDIKMRPVSRIMDKKLVTIDKTGRSGGGGSDSGPVIDTKQVLGPKRSLSLESLLDVISKEQRDKERTFMSKRSCKEQQQLHDTLRRAARADKTEGSITRGPPTGQPMRAVVTQCSVPLYAKPTHLRSHKLSDDIQTPSETSSCDSNNKGGRSAPPRVNTRKSDVHVAATAASHRTGRRHEPRWVENMVHNQHGYHPAVSDKQSRLSTALSKGHDTVSDKPRRKSEHVRASRWQPGQTHKWILDNNTTMLESTL